VAREHLRVLPATRSIQIGFTALTLSNPDTIRFRYRLEGVDKNWISVDSRRTAFYNNLKPGEYQFRVSASAAGTDKWRDAPALELEQLPFFYQTLWFTLLVSTAVISLIIIAYRLRVQQALNRIQAGFDERMGERTRIAQELHDTVAQTIAGSTMLVETAAEKVPNSLPLVKGALLRAVDQLDVALAQSRAALKGLRNTAGLDNDLAKQLSALTNSIDSQQIEFQMVITGESRHIRPMIQYEVFRVGSEAISNALKHSEATSIRVELGYENGLRLLVRDNGKGIPSDVLQLGKEGRFGLRGMRERADRIGAKLTVYSRVGAGTEVGLTVGRGVAFETDHASLTWFGRIVSRLRMLTRRSTPDDSPLV
jgi:signal transduction histidine kinase